MATGGNGRRLGNGLTKAAGLSASATRALLKEWFFGQTYPNLPYDMELHINDDPALVVHLIELQGAVPHYWTDAPIDLTYNGQTYSHIPFVLGDITTSVNGDQLASIYFDEQQQLIQGFDVNEGMRDRTITIYEVRIDGTDLVTVRSINPVAGPGTTEGIEFDETDDASVGVLSIRPQSLGTSGPRSEYQLTCINGYKDARCKYAGGIPDCDRTYDGPNGCVAHTNQPNFRGSRHALPPGSTVDWGSNAPVVLTGAFDPTRNPGWWTG
jgi:hypothetical protein